MQTGRPGVEESGASWWSRHEMTVLAAIVIAAATAYSFRDLLGEDLSRSTVLPTRHPYSAGAYDDRSSLYFAATDVRFVVWLLSRNAGTMLTEPWRLFDGEICHPEPESLALGEHAFTLSVLAIPAWLASGDPFVVFNWVLMAIPMLSAWALFLIVREWTGEPLAGLTAGLVYAFSSVKLADPSHPYLTDTLWTLLAIFFFRRWLDAGRWRDVAGLALSIAAQIGGSVYPLVGAMVLGSVFAVASLGRVRAGRTRPAQWAALVLFVAGIAAAVFAPFAAKSGAGVLVERPGQFLPWASVLPGGPAFPGWVVVALLGAALLPPRDGAPAVRLAWVAPFAIGAGLVLLVAAGGNEVAVLNAIARDEPLPPVLPNPFRWLSAWIPSLAAVRAPLFIATTAHLAISALAGLGAASLLQRLPARWATTGGVVLVALTFASVVVGREGDTPLLRAIDLHPGDELLAFYDALERKGNEGPLLELPVDQLALGQTSASIVAVAYHGRRTSRCYNSFFGPEVKATLADAQRLPDTEALERLRRRGFTTLILDHSYGRAIMRAQRRQLEALASAEVPRLAQVHATPKRTAWVILPPTAESERPRGPSPDDAPMR